MSNGTLSRLDFIDQLAAARRGQGIVYHVGWLIPDRSHGLDFMKVHGVALAAWDAYEKGICTLVQKTLTPGGLHDYIAVKL